MDKNTKPRENIMQDILS